MYPQGISVVIPFRNSEQTLGQTLDSLSRQEVDVPVELILVDDRSTDDSRKLIDEHEISSSWDVRFISNEEGGLANAYNLGWRAGKYETIVVMHSDCYVESESALQELIEPFSDEAVVASQPWTVVPLHTWDEMSFWDRVANARFVGVESAGLGGKFDAHRKSVLEKLGGFDSEHFFSAGEDVDITMRLKAVGKVASPPVRVIHRHLYPKNSSVKFLFSKQVQYGQGFGAIVRKYGRYTGSWITSSAQFAKLVLFVGVCIPATLLPALLALCLMAAAFSWRAFGIRDWRVIGIIPVNIVQWIVFYASVSVGLVTGRQAVYYK